MASTGVPRKLSKKSSQRRRKPTPARLDSDIKARDFGVRPLSPIRPTSPIVEFYSDVKVMDSREDITALPDRDEFHRRPAPPLQHSQNVFSRRPDTSGTDDSAEEDITALPFSKELRTSPHLRPATQDTADIPYNWNLQMGSHHSLPAATRESSRGKLQRDPSRNKRAAYDSPIARRKPSKKRKDEHLREEEIRAMSAPIPIPRRSHPSDTGLLRRDSKKMRGGLNRNLERPMSNISLPAEDSIHSSMSAASESRNYRLSVLDIVAPRPTIKYTVQNPYSIYSQPPRVESRARRTPTGKMVLEQRARIDSLADDLDSTDLRELMERDKRRKEKKRKNDIEKVHRKLQKRVDKQRQKDYGDQEFREQEVTRTQAPRTRDVRKAKESQATIAKETGLGIDTTSSRRPEVALEQRPSEVAVPQQETNTTAGAEPTFHMDDIEEFRPAVSPAVEVAPTPVLTTPNILAREEIPRMPLLSSHGDDEDDRRTLETAFEEPEIQMEDSDLAYARADAYTQGHISPSTSPLYQGDRTKASKVLGEDVAMGDYSKVSKLLGENVPRPASFTPPPGATRRESAEPQERKRSGMWSALFRRDRKSSTEPANRDSRSEASFSNTSRESMSRHMPPSHLYQPPNNTTGRSSSLTPVVRTQSKFREDLPELPVSPPDSRVQSPEATAPETKAIATRRGFHLPSSIHTDNATRRISSPYENLTSRGRTDSPASGGRQSNIMSQSLASVDSEASWLSGRPHRMSSTARKHNSTGTASITRAADEFSASYEELGIPDDEYFRRLNTQHGDGRHASGLSAAMRISHKASSSAIAAGSGASDTDDELRSSPPRPKQEGETVVHTGASRHPTVVHREARVRSSEGLLNQYLETDEHVERAYITPQDSPIREKHDEEGEPSETTPLKHARSVNLGKEHARKLSAGSAKLLDIAKRGSPASTAPATPKLVNTTDP
jgi:hypothetical protein